MHADNRGRGLELGTSGIQASPHELDLYRHGLNRLLLEDAYPQELAKKQTIQWTHYYVAVKH